MAFKISEISPDYEAWISLQASSSFVSPFQTPEYYEFLKSQKNHIPLVLSVRDAKSVLSALVVIDIQSNGNRLMRYFTSRAIVHGGPLVSPDCPDEALQQLLCEAIKLSCKNDAVYFEIRPYFDYSRYAGVFSSCGMNVIDYGDCIVDTSSLDTIDRNIQPRKGRQIRAAIRQGIRFVDNPTDETQIRDFYAMLRQKHWQRSGRPVPSLQYFLDLSKTSLASILLAYYQDEMIAGSVILHLPSNMAISSQQSAYHYYVAGLDDIYDNLAPSSVITYHSLQYSNQIGSRQISLIGAGRLSVPFGVRDFKVRMGARVVPYGRYLFLIHPFIYKLASFALNILHRSNTRGLIL